MKRSEMLALIALNLARQAITSGDPDVNISCIDVDALLTKMEKAGMRPPVVYMADVEPDWFGGGIFTEDWIKVDEKDYLEIVCPTVRYFDASDQVGP